MFELTDAFGELRSQVIVVLEALLDFHHQPISMPGIMSSAIENGASHPIAVNDHTAGLHWRSDDR